VGALGQLTRSSAFITQEVQPALKGSNRTAAVFNTRSRWGVGGVGFYRFGDDLYSEQLISIGFSNTLGMASLGAKLNYVQYRAEGFGTRMTTSLDIGGLANITNLISIGASITNLTQSDLSGEPLPTKFIAGIGLMPNKYFVFSAEIEKDLNYPATWKFGSEFTVSKKLFVRTGFNLHPVAVFCGWGIQRTHLRIDYSIHYNRLLLSTHQASATVLLHSTKKK
jgi:hypothetical protein